ncbi:MAG TPA: serine hydrolase [Planctomycetes bacterium]|nr:serine hydrolase [Planctomycetota bacterium]
MAKERNLRLRVLSGATRFVPRLRRVAAGYAAKLACSALFHSGRELEAILREDLEGIPGAELSVDRERREVRARVRDCERRALWREDIGGVLLHEDEQLSFPQLPPRAAPQPSQPWPGGEEVPAEWPLPAAARAALSEVLDEAFAEPGPKPRRTRAVVIVQRGQLVAERYAPGFDAAMPLLGWSMTKSVVNALCGRLVAQGKLDVQDRIGAPEWSAPGDPRAELTFDQLLRMSSGLRFWEQYWNPFSHVVGMLFAERSTGAHAAEFPLVAKPDARWSYASGTSNILARAARERASSDLAESLAYPYRELFDKLGMHSARFELDASGNFVGSSFCWATARDWARFGQLYLQRGAWGGEQLLPQGWWDYTRRPTPRAPAGEYGAHFWLNAGRGSKRMHPGLPDELVMARGFEEQSVTIVPSRELVIVRLGQTGHRPAWDFDGFVAGVLKALPE